MYRPISLYRFIALLLMLMLIFVFSGCVSSKVDPKLKTSIKQKMTKSEQIAAKNSSQALTQPTSVKVPQHDPSQVAHLGQVRLDLAAVLQGLYYRLQGYKGDIPGNLAFDPNIKNLNQDIDVPLSRFALRQISIRQDRSHGDDPFHRRIQAVLKVADSLDRQLFIMVAADYIIGNNVVYIRQAATTPYYPEFSDVRFMILPAGRLPSLKFLNALPFEELFSLAAENALSTAQLKAVKPGSTNHFLLIAFNMVKTTPGNTLNIYTSKNATAGSVQVKESRSLNKQGWTIAIVDGQFELNTAAGFWFYAGMTDENRSGKSKLLSKFSSVIGK